LTAGLHDVVEVVMRSATALFGKDVLAAAHVSRLVSVSRA
jgi:hypothetical protein